MTRPVSLPSNELLNRFHVVLVEPGDSLNVGAVARAMSNLGFMNLHLVAPPRYNREQAAVTACWATDLLDGARIHSTLAEALAPMEQVVGFTARHGRHRPQHVTLSQWSATLAAAPPPETALLFGPEDTGLRSEHLSACRWLVRIPSGAANPSFNLAQSVLLALFEVSRLHWEDLAAPPGPPPAREADLQQLERIVEEVLVRSGFYGKGTPAPLPDLIKHLLRRIGPDAREMPVLMAMFDRINRTLSGRSPAQPYPKAQPNSKVRPPGEPEPEPPGAPD